MPESSRRTPRPARAALRLVVTAVATVAAVGTTVLPAAAKQPKPVVSMPVGELTVYGVTNTQQTLPAEVRDQVMATLTRYVNAATVTPLRKGSVDATALGAALGPAVNARLGGTDRTVLVDEGMPRATGRVVVKATPVRLTALADGDGRVVVVTAALDTTTKTKTAKGKLQIVRNGEFVLEPDAGGWKITGYTLTVDRLGRGLGPAPAPAPPATATPAPAPAAPGAATR